MKKAIISPNDNKKPTYKSLELNVGFTFAKIYCCFSIAQSKFWLDKCLLSISIRVFFSDQVPLEHFSASMARTSIRTYNASCGLYTSIEYVSVQLNNSLDTVATCLPYASVMR